MFYSIPEIVTSEVPVVLDQATGQSTTSPISASRVLQQLNLVVDRLHDMAANRNRPEIVEYLNMSTADTTNGLLTPTLPLKVKRVICLTSRSNTDVEEPFRLERVATHQHPWTGASASGINYRLAGLPHARKVYVLPATGDSTYYRLWYVPHIPRIHYSQVASGQTASTTELYMDTTPDNGVFQYQPANVYVNQLIYIYEGAGIGQLARVTAFNASTNVATVEKAESPGSALDTALSTTSYYSLQPWWNDFYPLIILATAARFTGLDAAQAIMGTTLADAMSSFMDWLEVADDSSPEPIVRKFASDLGLYRGGSAGGPPNSLVYTGGF